MNRWSKKTKHKWLAVGVSAAIVMIISQLTAIGAYIEDTKASSVWSTAFLQEDQIAMTQEELKLRIEKEAEAKNIAPIDARIDRVWKAIPGYNGLEVDVEATLKRNASKRQDELIDYVMREIKPNTTLQELPPTEIYRGNEKKPAVALMINVAWGNEFIRPMLDTLKKEGVKATFFFDGSWVKKNPELAKEIASEGHEIGNHAYSHPNMNELSEGRQYQEIDKTKKVITETIGEHSEWFAPPSGAFNSLTVKTAHQLGLKTVLWTVDTIDWQKPSPGTVVSRVRNKVSAGSLILMHPTASSSAALADMIAVIRQKELVPGTVSEALSERRLKDTKVE
ncbi:polysaccharide deacetylase family protein [Paenibacillus sp. 1001270B_150601_E10]|uniref:polysaccharide deacetylase family protein n=1 Tax=Paenibacillus sp. 1001270B_150601_E10 TaxID=2787079 RepID=UPI00189E4CFB|nr:polysaccharide deacetylase family protein [Paenibacillus sp. 1001270B_150601_E10]